MIEKIRVSNFRSVVDVTLMFTYDEGKAPNGYEESPKLAFVEDAASGFRCVPIMAYYGANASGKTNLLRAVVNLLDVASGTRCNDVRTIFKPNLISKVGRETEFEIEYFAGSGSFRYLVAYSAEGLSHEQLFKNGQELFVVKKGHLSIGPALRLTEAYTQQTFQERLDGECTDGQGHVIRSFLSLVGLHMGGASEDIRVAHAELANRVAVYGFDRPAILPQAVHNLCEAAKISQEEALDRIVDLVRRLDNDLASVEVLELEDPKRRGVFYEIRSHHVSAEGRDVVFEYEQDESAGTVRLAAMVGNLLSTIERGSVCFIDEVELSLHPLLVRELLGLFRKKEFNRNGAQLIFTTHLTDIMDDQLLRLSEIGIVTKNKFNGSKVRRVIDMKNAGEDIRNVTNFRKRYLDGYFAGVPRGTIG